MGLRQGTASVYGGSTARGSRERRGRLASKIGIIDLEAVSRTSSSVPIVLPGDAMLALTEPVHFAVARTLDGPRADRLAESLARVATRMRPTKYAALARRYREMVGPDRAGMPTPGEYVRAHIASQLRGRTLYARLAADPAWRPHLEVKGIDALAQAEGCPGGALVWELPLQTMGLFARMACADRGMRLHHISHWRHGPSRSRLGRRLFNHRDCRIESGFGPRYIVREEDTHSALSAVRRVLREGGLVGFRGIDWARRPACYPLLAGQLRLALGAPVTARRVGAALFTAGVASIEGGYRVEFQPLAMGDRPLEDIGAEFATRLEDAILRSPDLWSVGLEQWQPAGWPDEPEPAPI